MNGNGWEGARQGSGRKATGRMKEFKAFSICGTPEEIELLKQRQKRMERLSAGLRLTVCRGEKSLIRGRGYFFFRERIRKKMLDRLYIQLYI